MIKIRKNNKEKDCCRKFSFDTQIASYFFEQGLDKEFAVYCFLKTLKRSPQFKDIRKINLTRFGASFRTFKKYLSLAQEQGLLEMDGYAILNVISLEALRDRLFTTGYYYIKERNGISHRTICDDGKIIRLNFYSCKSFLEEKDTAIQLLLAEDRQTKGRLATDRNQNEVEISGVIKCALDSSVWSNPDKDCLSDKLMLSYQMFAEYIGKSSETARKRLKVLHDLKLITIYNRALAIKPWATYLLTTNYKSQRKERRDQYIRIHGKEVKEVLINEYKFDRDQLWKFILS